MLKTISLSILVLTAAATPAFAEDPGTSGVTPTPTSDEAAPRPSSKDESGSAPSSKADLLDPFADPEPPHTVTAEVTTTKQRSAQTTLSFRNEAGTAFTLSEARFVMDGKELPTVIANPERGKSYVIYTGAVAPGQHVVTVNLVYQGQRRGAFTYMRGYKLNVSSDGVFTTPEDRTMGFTIVSKEQKGINVPLEKRIAVGVEPAPSAR